MWQFVGNNRLLSFVVQKLDCNLKTLGKRLVFVPVQTEVVHGKLVEIRNFRVYPKLGCRVLRAGKHTQNLRFVSVVNMRVGNDVNQFANFQSADLLQHMHKHRILHHVPIVGNCHIVGALVQNCVQFALGDVERYAVRAGVQIHFVQVMMNVNVGYYATAVRVVLKVVQHAVDLVEQTFLVDVFYAQLIAVGFADTARFVRPTVPNVTVQVVNVVGFFLPNPQQLVHGGLECRATKRYYRELLRQVVAIDNAKQLFGVRGSAVRPMRTHFGKLVAETMVYYVGHVLNEYFVGFAHFFSPAELRLKTQSVLLDLNDLKSKLHKIATESNFRFSQAAIACKTTCTATNRKGLRQSVWTKIVFAFSQILSKN